MARRTPIIAILIPLLGAVSMGPTEAAPSDLQALALSDIPLPRGAITATASEAGLEVRAPGLRPDELLLDNLDPTDVRTFPDAIRAFIQTTAGVRLPDLRPEHSATPGIHSPEARVRTLAIEGQEPTLDAPEEEPSGVISYPSSAGDLTGDGLADVLVEEISLPQEELTLRALRGVDGSCGASISTPQMRSRSPRATLRETASTTSSF